MSEAADPSTSTQGSPVTVTHDDNSAKPMHAAVGAWTDSNQPTMSSEVAHETLAVSTSSSQPPQSPLVTTENVNRDVGQSDDAGGGSGASERQGTGTQHQRGQDTMGALVVDTTTHESKRRSFSGPSSHKGRPTSVRTAPSTTAASLRAFTQQQLSRTAMSSASSRYKLKERPKTSGSRRSARPSMSTGRLTPHQPKIRREKYTTPGPGAFNPNEIHHRHKAAPSYSFSRSHTTPKADKRASTASSDPWWKLDEPPTVTPKRKGHTTGPRQRSRTPTARSRTTQAPVVSPLVAERPRTSGGTHDRRRRGEGNHGESGGVRLTVLTEGENVAPGVGTYNTPSSSFGKQRVGTAKSGSRATFGTASKSSIGTLYIEGMMDAPPASAVYAKSAAGVATPGVGDYNPKPRMRRTPSFGFPTAPRSKDDALFSDGGHAAVQKRGAGKRSMRGRSKTPTAAMMRRTASRRTMKQAMPDAPGPGDYDWANAKEKSRMRSGPAQSFSKATRFKRGSKKKKKKQMRKSLGAKPATPTGANSKTEGDPFAAKLSRHRSSPAVSMGRTPRWSDSKDAVDERAHGVDAPGTRNAQGFTIPRSSNPSGPFGGGKKGTTPGPADYDHRPIRSLGQTQRESKHRTQPGVMFGATTNHAPPPDSVRAIFGVGKGKPKGKPKRRSPRRQAKVEEEEGSDGEEITPGPTDHCKDMGIGMKQVLSNKPGTPVARIGTEKRGFTKLYTSKKDVCGKGDINATSAPNPHAPAPWDYNPSATVGGRAATRMPAYTFAGAKTTFSRNAMRQQLQAEIASEQRSASRAGKNKTRKGRLGRRRKKATKKRGTAVKCCNASTAAKAEAPRPQSRQRVIDVRLMPHSISTDAGPGSYSTDALGGFGSLNKAGRRRNVPSAVMPRTSRAKNAKVVAPDATPEASVATPGPGAYGEDGSTTGKKLVLSRHRTGTRQVFARAPRTKAPMAPDVTPVSQLVTPSAVDYDAHVARDRTSKSKRSTGFRFGTTQRGAIEVPIG